MRAEVWDNTIDRLNSLVPKAIEGLEDAIDNKRNTAHRQKLQACIAVLRIAERFNSSLVDPVMTLNQQINNMIQREGPITFDIQAASGKPIKTVNYSDAGVSNGH